ncbi:MAG: hypothetical protein ACOX6U_11400 [Oscillospiraceae bacterium]
MIYVSPEYMKAVTAPSRTMGATVTLDLTDLSALDNISDITANSNDNRYSFPWKTVDGINKVDVNYGTCERDQFATSDFYLLPHEMLEEAVEWGWWSAVQSDDNGEFELPPAITWTFDAPVSTLGITLWLLNEAKELQLTWLSQDGSALDTLTLYDAQGMAPVEHAVENYYGLTATFLRMKPRQYVKLLEIAFGLRYTYTDSELTSISMLEETDLTSNTISSNSAEITLKDFEQKFNLFNPQNRSRFLQQRQKLRIDSSLLTEKGWELVPMGQFYLSEWNSPTPYTVQFEALDAVSLLDTAFHGTELFEDKPAGELLRSILTAAGFRDYSARIGSDMEPDPLYYIHENVQDSKLAGYLDSMTCREALQRVAFACNAVVHVDREGVLNIYRATQDVRNKLIIDSHTIYRASYPCGGLICGRFPLLRQTTEPLPNPITIDRTLSDLPDATLGEQYNAVELEQYHWEPETERTTLYEGDLTGDVYVPYQSSPCIDISGGGNYYRATFYACGAYIEGAHGAVQITGVPCTEKKQILTLHDTSVHVGKTLSVTGITLFGNAQTVETTAQWLLEQVKGVATQKFKWWTNPALEVSDWVKIENQFGDMMTAQVSQNQFDYSGGWIAESEVSCHVDYAENGLDRSAGRIFQH